LLGCGAADVIYLLALFVFASKKITRLGKVRGRAMAMEAARLRRLRAWQVCCCFLATNMTTPKRLGRNLITSVSYAVMMIQI
jgi:hypothetical protein